MTAGWRAFAARVDAATPARRDRVVDGLRAIAMLGIVGGHWLVTGLVVTPDGDLRQASPLAAMPELVPATWLLQTLGLFFCVAGYAGAASYSGGYRRWLAARVARIARPVGVFVLVWALVLALMADSGSLWTVGKLAFSPLWFFVPFLVLTALTPVAIAAHRRFGLWSVLPALAVVVVVDTMRYAVWPDFPAAMVNVLAAWLIPYQLGVAWARGGLDRPAAARWLLAGGLVVGAALVLAAGYPASLVGVPSDGRSNLNPPSLLAVALAAVQIGVALLCRQRLATLLRRPGWWAVVALLNLAAITVFLWHQTALLTVAGAGLAVGTLPGLHTAPTGAGWVVARVGWLPVFLAVLVALWAVFGRSAGRPVKTTLRTRQE